MGLDKNQPSSSRLEANFTFGEGGGMPEGLFAEGQFVCELLAMGRHVNHNYRNRIHQLADNF